MKTRILTITTIFFITVSVSAQTKFAANYSVGIPMGETSDLFSGASWRGVNLDFSYFLNTNMAIGLVEVGRFLMMHVAMLRKPLARKPYQVTGLITSIAFPYMQQDHIFLKTITLCPTYPWV
mgnify:CR=1 FL=1